MGLHGVSLAVKDVHAVIRVAAAGEQHRHAKAGTVALGESGAAGPDELLAVQRKAGLSLIHISACADRSAA